MCKRLAFLTFLLCAGMCSASAADSGDMFQSLSWDTSSFASWKREDGKKILFVEIPPSEQLTNETRGITAELDVNEYRGKNLLLSIEMKGENIPAGENPSYCAKLMLCTRDSRGVSYVFTDRSLWGTFDWKKLTLPYIVPDDCKQLTLMVGIQCNHGKIQARNLQIREEDPYPPPVPLPENFRCRYTEEYRKLPRLRGFGSEPSESILQTAREWKCNVVRYWLPCGERDPNLPGLEKELLRLKRKLPEYRKARLHVILTIPTPGGRYETPLILGTAGTLAGNPESSQNFRLFNDDKWLSIFISAWEKVARELRDCPEIVGYDLMNEPSQVGKTKNDYLKVQYLAAKAIRAIDPERPIIVSANDWSKPSAFRYLKPLPFRNIVYQVHIYDPGEYTHQGVSWRDMEQIRKGKRISYPGRINEVWFDKSVLRAVLEPVRKFQKKYGAEIFCGEFSVINWAPGAEQYLDDVCSLLEEFNWNWCYHGSADGWYGWNVECTFDVVSRRARIEETPRKKILLKYLRKNLDSSPGKGKRQMP